MAQVGLVKTIKIKIDKSTKINLEKEYSSSDLKDISVTQAAKIRLERSCLSELIELEVI